MPCGRDLDERLQRVKPLCYPPTNLIRGKSLWASSPQVGMGIWGKLCELVAVGPGGSGVRAAKA